MKTATLATPFNVNPTGTADGAKTVAKLQLRSVTIDFASDTVRVYYVALDASGEQVDAREVVASGPAVATWIGQREDAILGFLMSKLATAGSIA